MSDVTDPLRELVRAAALDTEAVRLYGVLDGPHLREPAWQALDHPAVDLRQPPLELLRAAAHAAATNTPFAFENGFNLHALGAAHAGFAQVRLVGIDIDAGAELALRVRDVIRTHLHVDPVITSGSGRAGRFWLRWVFDAPLNAANIPRRLLGLLAREGITTGKGNVEVYPSPVVHKTTLGRHAVLVGLNGRLPCGLGGCSVFTESGGELVATETDPQALAAQILATVASAKSFLQLPKADGTLASSSSSVSSGSSGGGRRQRTARVTSDVWTRVRSHLASPRAPGQRERPPSGFYTPRRVATLLPLAMQGQRVDTCLLAYGAARRTGLAHLQAIEALVLWARAGGLRKTRMGQGAAGEESLEDFLSAGLLRICDAANAGWKPIRTRREPLADLTPSEILNLRRLALRAAASTETSFRAAMTMAVEFVSLQRAARVAGHDDTRLRARRLGSEDPNLGWEELAGGVPQYAQLRAALGIQRTAKHCRGITAASYSLPYRPNDETPVLLGDGTPAERLECACAALHIDPVTGERHRLRDDPVTEDADSQTRNTSSPRDLGPSGLAEGPLHGSPQDRSPDSS